MNTKLNRNPLKIEQNEINETNFRSLKYVLKKCVQLVLYFQNQSAQYLEILKIYFVKKCNALSQLKIRFLENML